MVKSRGELLKLSKKVVGKSVYSKLKKIEDEDEFRQAAQYAMVSALKVMYQDMELQVMGLEKQMRDVFFAKYKLMHIPGKIRNFQVDFEEKELEKLSESFNSVKEEMKDV